MKILKGFLWISLHLLFLLFHAEGKIASFSSILILVLMIFCIYTPNNQFYCTMVPIWQKNHLIDLERCTSGLWLGLCNGLNRVNRVAVKRCDFLLGKIAAVVPNFSLFYRLYLNFHFILPTVPNYSKICTRYPNGWPLVDRMSQNLISFDQTRKGKMVYLHFPNLLNNNNNN